MSLLNSPDKVPVEGDVVVKVETKRDGPNDPYGACWVTFASGKKVWFSLYYEKDKSGKLYRRGSGVASSH